MRQTHVRGIDLGLLTTLQALVEERSITRAAERMFLSQPAMSRAFDRLQELFNDELLVRTRQGYEPTLRALHLYAEIERLMPSLESLLRGDDSTRRPRPTPSASPPPTTPPAWCFPASWRA
jgi:DNA-binding transcriptional LysR family regulator